MTNSPNFEHHGAPRLSPKHEKRASEAAKCIRRGGSYAGRGSEAHEGAGLGNLRNKEETLFEESTGGVVVLALTLCRARGGSVPIGSGDRIDGCFEPLSCVSGGSLKHLASTLRKLMAHDRPWRWLAWV